jgi:hypothetical protein
MNDFDEFAEIALAIFLALTLLIWVLTYLERTLIDPASQHRNRRRARPPGPTASRDEPPTDPTD